MSRAGMSGEQAFWNSRNKFSAQYMFNGLTPQEQQQFMGTQQPPPEPAVVDEVEIIDPITKAVTRKPLTRVPKQ